MRSDNEIKEIYKSVIRNIHQDMARAFEGVNGHGEYWHHHCEDHEGEPYQEAYILLDYLETHLDEHLKIIKEDIGEIIEGEPRYSIEELEKIAVALGDGFGQGDVELDEMDTKDFEDAILPWIKRNPEKVKEILESE